MLTDHFSIYYRWPRQTPIQVHLTGNHVLIDCRFHYNARALQTVGPDGKSLADHIEAGIIHKWSGFYSLELAGQTELVRVSVQISRQRDRRSVPVVVRRLLLMPAHVISPWYRRGWGIAKTGQIESIGTNWSRQQPGRMVLPSDLQPSDLAAIAAHEAGHLFGLGDAYAAIYRFYDATPGTEHYMMHSNQSVQPAEILMLLRAHQSGRMQFFPRHWQASRFWHGLRNDYQQRLVIWQQRHEQLQQEQAGWKNGTTPQQGQTSQISGTAPQPQQTMEKPVDKGMEAQEMPDEPAATEAGLHEAARQEARLVETGQHDVDQRGASGYNSESADSIDTMQGEIER